MLRIDRVEGKVLEKEPYGWAFIDQLFAPGDAAKLAASFPRDQFKTIAGYDGEKGYQYEARSLIHMGAHAASFAPGLSPAWRELAADLLSPAYRSAMARGVSIA